jgi:hypothetical protein
MANPGRGGAWHVLFSARWFWFGFKRVATMGTGLACSSPHRNTWRVRVGAAHGIMFDGFGMGSSVLQRWVPVWPVLVRA